MRIRVDVPFYAGLLDAYSAARDPCAIRQAHARILTVGIAHHDFLRTKLCSAYARCARLQEAGHILSRANRRPAFLFNSLIRALADLRRFPAALGLYRQMRGDGAAPDPRTMAAVLRSCTGLQSLRLGRLTHAAVLVAGHAPDAAVSNSLISMYSKCGDLASARHVFDGMAERRNLVSWTAMIAACGAHGRPVAELVCLVEGMLAEEAKEPPDAEAMTAVLAACARGGLTEVGRRLFCAMREGRFGLVRPGVEHYTCMVDMLGRAGHVDEAEALIRDMEVEPDEALWRALLGACRAHSTLDVAERVKDLFRL